MKEYILRYQRHIILDGFGMEAQQKLSNANVLVIGVGGLGCPIVQYLAAAGVGHIGIADHDIISLSNLNRQILFGEADIGKYKVDVAVEKIRQLNKAVKVTLYKKRWTAQLSISHFPSYDIIIDATDNFESRYLINDGCVLLNKPYIFGAVSKFEGQVSVFNVTNNNISIQYRDLFPIPPKSGEVLSCAEGGVLGVLPGMIGVLQATEAIKLITGVGKGLANQLLTFDALHNTFNTIQLVKNPNANPSGPQNLKDYVNMNYEYLCQ